MLGHRSDGGAYRDQRVAACTPRGATVCLGFLVLAYPRHRGLHRSAHRFPGKAPTDQHCMHQRAAPVRGRPQLHRARDALGGSASSGRPCRRPGQSPDPRPDSHSTPPDTYCPETNPGTCMSGRHHPTPPYGDPLLLPTTPASTSQLRPRGGQPYRARRSPSASSTVLTLAPPHRHRAPPLLPSRSPPPASHCQSCLPLGSHGRIRSTRRPRQRT